MGVIQREAEVPGLLSIFYIHQPTVIYDRDGRKVSEIFGKKTSNLEWEAYPENLKRMVLLVEDRSFFSHGGIHYSSVLRAFFVNVISLRFKQGASTITQQLARILLNDREKSLGRNRITSYNVCYTKLLRPEKNGPSCGRPKLFLSRRDPLFFSASCFFRKRY
nr:biosynthetic peptidoglycan transglycosylase [Leptospira licerasiae]